MVKPVIFCLDDDLEVLAAIERDLRNHYSSRYRIIKASSGTEAVQAVHQLKSRNVPIAIFLVDQRMPGMTGTQFLNNIKKIYPDSCKVLLTAYADTEAAIVSINEVNLDHYLLKPWDPPEVKLFPVLDDLLSLWSSKVKPVFEGIRVIGARWSPQSYEVKEFLSRNNVPYQWVDIELDQSMNEFLKKTFPEPQNLPVILFPDGSSLQMPTNIELAEKLGIQTKAKLPFYDLVVIGCGPAGLANAVYATSEGLKTIVIERNAPGGQAGTSSRIENYLGFPNGVTGADLTQRGVMQAKKFGAEIITAVEAVSIRREDPYRVVTLSNGAEISCYAVVISSGMAVRKLEAEGIAPLQGIGVYYGAAMTEAATYRDKVVCIVGGANSAGQGALFFSRYAKSVSMLIRGESLKKSMSQYLIDRIYAANNITVMPNVEIQSVHGEQRLESIKIKNLLNGESENLNASAMFIFIGVAPHSEFVNGLVCKDNSGFILTGPDLPKINNKPVGWTLDRDPFLFETNVPGIFAVGDVRSGANRRVASAVGEGSASIYMVHQYLQTV